MFLYVFITSFQVREKKTILTELVFEVKGKKTEHIRECQHNISNM